MFSSQNQRPFSHIVAFLYELSDLENKRKIVNDNSNFIIDLHLLSLRLHLKSVRSHICFGHKTNIEPIDNNVVRFCSLEEQKKILIFLWCRFPINVGTNDHAFPYYCPQFFQIFDAELQR